jgi:hypothetical protein
MANCQVARKLSLDNFHTMLKISKFEYSLPGAVETGNDYRLIWVDVGNFPG